MSDDRLQREREFFDRTSAEQFGDNAPVPTEHMVALLQLLGPTSGMRVLDAGCGAGDLALEIARDAAEVVGFDLSPESIKLMGARAGRLGVRSPAGLVAVMEHFPFPAGSFDVVVGKSILHHVDVAAAMREVHRVLRPGGRALFIENQVTNPLLRFARERLTGRLGVARLGTLDEHPLTKRDYNEVRQLFPSMTLRYPDFRFFGLFSRNVLRYRRALWLARALGKADAWVYHRFPPMRKWGYHVIIDARRP
ncbi:MAG: class I SAM-dependent methyltransferase [Actinomycetota bacterium]